MPVGFKWFVPGLLDGSVAFGGEESAGASFLQRDGSVWTTDKDGILLALLASEITAVTGKTPSELYRGLVARYGDPAYARIDSPATRAEKAALARLSPDHIIRRPARGREDHGGAHDRAGNGEPIGGLKVVTGSGWFTRPGRPAPKTYLTSSTPSRSAAPGSWPRSRRRPGPWWRLLLADPGVAGVRRRAAGWPS